jgi:hypothetical protein
MGRNQVRQEHMIMEDMMWQVESTRSPFTKQSREDMDGEELRAELARVDAHIEAVYAEGRRKEEVIATLKSLIKELVLHDRD